MTASRHSRYYLLFLLLGMVSSTLHAQETSVFNTQQLQPSARIGAMGGNFFAVKDGDVSMAYINPSSIDSSMHGKLSLSYLDFFSKTNFGYAAYGRNINSKLSTAATVQFVSHGTMEAYDALGNQTGTFSAGDYFLNLGAGYKMDSLWTIGANARILYSNIAELNSLAIATDFAATFHQPRRNLTITGIIRNVGIQLNSFHGTREKIPFEFQVGITKKPKYAPFRFSVVADNLQTWDLRYNSDLNQPEIDPVTGEVLESTRWEFGDIFMRHIIFGTEFLLGENIVIRGAYNYRRRQELKVEDKPGMAGFSFGLGFGIKKFRFNYSRAIYHLAGPANHFTVDVNIHDVIRPAK